MIEFLDLPDCPECEGAAEFSIHAGLLTKTTEDSTCSGEHAMHDADRWPDASGGMPSRDRFFRNPADSDGRSRACLGGLHERLSCYLTKEASNHG